MKTGYPIHGKKPVEPKLRRTTQGEEPVCPIKKITGIQVRIQEPANFAGTNFGICNHIRQTIRQTPVENLNSVARRVEINYI